MNLFKEGIAYIPHAFLFVRGSPEDTSEWLKNPDMKSDRLQAGRMNS